MTWSFFCTFVVVGYLVNQLVEQRLYVVTTGDCHDVIFNALYYSEINYYECSGFRTVGASIHECCDDLTVAGRMPHCVGTEV